MAGISKKELSARRQRLLDALPDHGWDYAKAGVAAGYSPAYARTHLKTYVTQDSTFCQQVSAKRAEIDAQQVGKRERCLRVLDSIIENEEAADRDRIRAVETRGKMCGWMSQTMVLETPERQRELDQAALEVARRAALATYDTRRLRDGRYATLPESAADDQTDQQEVSEPTPAPESA